MLRLYHIPYRISISEVSRHCRAPLYSSQNLKKLYYTTVSNFYSFLLDFVDRLTNQVPNTNKPNLYTFRPDNMVSGFEQGLFGKLCSEYRSNGPNYINRTEQVFKFVSLLSCPYPTEDIFGNKMLPQSLEIIIFRTVTFNPNWRQTLSHNKNISQRTTELACIPKVKRISI